MIGPVSVVVAVVAVKGGTGKSATSAYLAEALARTGESVGLVDADPQGTLIEWEATAADVGEAFSVPVEGLPSAVLLARRLGGFARRFGVVVVDLPNRDTDVIEATLRQADLAVVPMPPGVEELRRANAARSMAAAHGVEAKILLTLVDRRTALAAEALAVLDATGVPHYRSHIRRLAQVAASVGARRPPDVADYRLLSAEVAEDVARIAGMRKEPASA